MGEWLATNWLPLVVLLVVIIGMVIYLLKRKGLRQLAIDAIVWAEREFSTEEGQEKMQQAIDYCQQLMPFLNLIPDAIIKGFIQGVFDQIKAALDQVPMDNKAVIEEIKAVEGIEDEEAEG